LNDVFASLGIDDTPKVARAIIAQHAPEYVTPACAMLEALSELARNGHVRGFAHAFLWAETRRDWHRGQAEKAAQAAEHADARFSHGGKCAEL
jgi:hypothetical protein